jgi:hypothetical protein
VNLTVGMWNSSSVHAQQIVEGDRGDVYHANRAGQLDHAPGLLGQFRDLIYHNLGTKAFRASYEGLSENDLLKPGVTGRWSIRDIIAHVTTWEEEALKHLPAVLEGRRPPRYSVTYGGIDAFNALMTHKKEHLSLAEVFRQRDEVHRRLIDVIERTPAAQLAADTRFRRRLRLDTYGHYPKHTAAIHRWRERIGSS